MKKILFFLALLNFLTSTSQNKGIVYYGHIESPGKGGPVGLDFNSYLVFDKSQSYYVTAKDSLENETNIENQKIKKIDGQITEIYLGKHTLEQGKQVYYNREKDSIWWNKKYQKPVYGVEKRTEIPWKLINESKKIGNLLCKKATGTFRGREYTVWYSVEIPLPYGPWKLQGLPGLILEAYDTNKELYIYFKSVEYPVKKNIGLHPLTKTKDDKDLKWISLNEYNELLKATVEKGKTKAILMAKEYGVNVQSGEMKDISIEIFD